jgi:hypothetical protein
LVAVRLEPLAGAVRRPIVDDDDLRRPAGLRQNAVNTRILTTLYATTFFLTIKSHLKAIVISLMVS